MRMHRALALSLFALLLATVGCPQKIVKIPGTPEMLGVTVNPGDTVTWKLPDEGVQQLTIWIPDNLCKTLSVPPSSDQDGVKMIILSTAQGTPKVVKCKVGDKAGTLPIQYGYDIVSSTLTSPIKKKGISGGGPTVMLIPSSCAGCGNNSSAPGPLNREIAPEKEQLSKPAPPKTPTNDPNNPQRIACLTNGKDTVPNVVNPANQKVPTLYVPSGINSAAWYTNTDNPPGTSTLSNWTVTFSSSPCVGGATTFGNNNATCNLDLAKFPAYGQPANTYTYTVTLDACTKASTDTYTLSLQAPLSPP
jgi:hypothetical protein